ncbi:hypothetical protein, partial [Mucilaginibacter sp.]|uniref:hypothetical protein n=1 Tax=Mucilaginibacter sp. TaxID=1882438 RepID=UPI00263667B8
PRFGIAKVETFSEFANFIFLFFQAAFSIHNRIFVTSFAGCKGANKLSFCQVKFSLFFNLIYSLNLQKTTPFLLERPQM